MPDDSILTVLTDIRSQLSAQRVLLDTLVGKATRGPGRPKIERPLRKCGWRGCNRPNGLFEPRRTDQIYCSQDCRMAGWRDAKVKQELDMLKRQQEARTQPTVVMKTPEQEAQFLARVHEVGLAQALAEDEA